VGALRRHDGRPQDHEWGFQALEAQAVATRSYVAAEIVSGGWAPYATACDSYCQSYPGMVDENPMSNAAESERRARSSSSPPRPACRALQADTGHLCGARDTRYGLVARVCRVLRVVRWLHAERRVPRRVDRGDAVCIKSRFLLVQSVATSGGRRYL